MLQTQFSKTSSNKKSALESETTPVVNPVKKIVLNIIKLSVTVGILVYLYQKGMLDFSRVHAVMTNVPIVALTFSIFVLNQMAGVIRWRWLLQGQGLQLSFKETTFLTMIGVFFNTAIPGAVSGDVIKGYYVVKKQSDGKGKVKAFTTLLLDRILGLSALIFVSFCAMLLHLNSSLENPTLKPLCGMISILLAGIIVFYAFVLIRIPFTEKIQNGLVKLPMGEIFLKLFNAFRAYEKSKTTILKGFAISVVIHLMLISTIVILSRHLPGFESVPLDKFYFLVPFGLLVTAIPIAPAGLGTGHAAFLGLFKLVGSKSGADLFTAFVSFQLIMSLIGGIFYIRYKSDLS